MGRPPAPGPFVFPQGVEIRMIWQNNQRTWHNVLHAKAATPATVSQALADSLMSNFSTSLNSSGFTAHLFADTELVQVGVRDVNTANNVEWLSSGAAVPGVGVGPAMPLNDSICITWVSAKTGRENRGRIYFAGLDASAAASATTVAPTALSQAEAFATGLHTNINSAGLTHCIANRQLLAGKDAHGNDLPPRTATSVDVAAAKVTDNRFDSQRRRLGR
jgi:hypothetical protein